MTTIFERTVSALTPLGLPVAASVYVTATGTDLPDMFLVYSLISSPPTAHANDQETLRTNRVQVSAYSRAGLVSLPNIQAAMAAAGFMAGPLYQLPYNSQTGHYGLAQEFVYLEDK